MKRYTFISDDYYAVSSEECFEDQSECYCGPAIDKLAEYENLKEAGRLVVLPCNIGDIIYQPGYKFTECTANRYTPVYIQDSGCKGCCSECDSIKTPFIYEGRVCKLNVLSNGEVLINVQFKEKWDNSSFMIGREVFLTREEAEERMFNT